MRNLKERDNLEDLDVGGRTILKWVFKEWEEGMHLVVSFQDSERFVLL